MNYTSISPSYIDCLFDHVLEDAFPRTEIACRYIAILLRINGRGETPGELGPYYERIWMYLYKAILSLYTRGHVSNITRIKPLLDILMKPASVVCVTWDPEKTVHP